MLSQPSIFSKRALCQEAFDWLIGHFSNQALLQFAQSDNARKLAELRKMMANPAVIDSLLEQLWNEEMERSGAAGPEYPSETERKRE